nr:carboxypeptidase regulatory-like domain-containing protein [Bacteroidota bacterium]
MKKITILLGLIILASFAFSQQVPGLLNGVVYDWDTELPIENALVEAELVENSTTTDQQGYYEMNLNGGLYDVTASADGYESLTIEDVNIYTAITTTINFELHPIPTGDQCGDGIPYTVVDDPVIYSSTTHTGDYTWYSVDNPVTQDFVVSLCGSEFNTMVAVYDNCEAWDGNFPDATDWHGAIAFNDDNIVCKQGTQPSLQSLAHLNWANPGTYHVLVWGSGGNFGNYELDIYSEQSQTTVVGWGGLSTYVDLDITKGKSMEEVFADVIPQLVIIFGESGIYWPGYNINTIGDFNTFEGYKVKWADETTWIVEGNIVNDRTVTFPAGTHMLPVLNITPVAVEGFITGLEQIVLMFDVDNNLIYWPDGGIIPGVEGALEYLIPGSAYLFECNAEVTFNFEPYAPDASGGITIPPDYFSTLDNKTPWGDVLKTGDHHIVGMDQNALNSLESGDYIGVFNSEGICTGMQLYTGKNTALAMAVNGDDVTTGEVDGMLNREYMNYKVYRDGQIFKASPVYNTNMPDYDGMFIVNGLSQIINFKLGSTSILEGSMSDILIYPNPSTGIFHIDLQGIENSMNLEVLNSCGQLIYSSKLKGSCELDLTANPQGIYFIRLVYARSVHLEKIVIK